MAVEAAEEAVRQAAACSQVKNNGGSSDQRVDQVPRRAYPIPMARRGIHPPMQLRGSGLL
eukprot:6016051-Prymnesium_polylepis.1